jgi:lipopolysaccharide assembly outer membrane protein LptD (OstA)
VTLNETPRSASSSDLLVGAEGRLSDVWSVVGLMQYNLDSGNTERFNFGGRYTPAPGRVVNATYSYTRDLVDPAGGSSILKQFDLSTQWPIAGSWSVLARWNYSLADSKTLEAVAGVEYNGDCWALRLVGSDDLDGDHLDVGLRADRTQRPCPLRDQPAEPCGAPFPATRSSTNPPARCKSAAATSTISEARNDRILDLRCAPWRWPCC